MLKEFREFIMRGNVVDLAVAVVIGAAFGAVVTALVEGIIMPLIAAIFGKPNFDYFSLTINGAEFRYGVFLTAVVNFLLIAAAVFLLVVKPMNMINERRRSSEEATERECPECTSEISVKARRCPHCTAEITPASA